MSHSHGYAGHGAHRTSEYMAWTAMIQRCENPRHKFWLQYGGRGISVCQRWRSSFENFLADMNRKSLPELTLERKNNEGNYAPDNCYWATPKQQANNRRRRHIGPMLQDRHFFSAQARR